MIKLRTEVLLLTPKGKTTVPIELDYEDSKDIIKPKSEITLSYGGIEYKGTGVDELWTDTLADLQSKLPEKCKIACCMTCRHGNMCPYGTVKNQLFCTKNVKISSKEDMCDLFDQSDPFQEREVTSFDCCDDFIYQSDAYYTYNDYLYRLSEKIGSK